MNFYCERTTEQIFNEPVNAISNIFFIIVSLSLIKILKKNQSTYIPLGSKHRLSNNGNETLILIEVQSGIYLGEDDIIRFKDKYGRGEKET